MVPEILYTKALELAPFAVLWNIRFFFPRQNVMMAPLKPNYQLEHRDYQEIHLNISPDGGCILIRQLFFFWEERQHRQESLLPTQNNPQQAA